MSDSPKTCMAVMALTSSIAESVITVARKRSNREIVSLLIPKTEETRAKDKIKLKKEIIRGTAGLLNKIPKSVEFIYNPKLSKMKPLLTNSTVSFSKLIKKLHVPPAHVGKEFKNCPSDCQQKRACTRLRETWELSDLIKSKLGDIHPIYQDMDLSLVGSIRENTRAFFLDESDVHLSLAKNLKHFTYFDTKEQVLKRDPNKPRPNNHTDKYFDSENTFKAQNFLRDYIEAVHSIVSTLKLPAHFTMRSLTTTYTPCTRCMSTDTTGTPQARRCRHTTDCLAHAKCQCKDTSKCEEECEHKCDCKNYTSPSISWSKIGIVLHLEWVEEDGRIESLDCDLNVPTIPCGTPYDGGINDAAKYLLRTRPYGWVEESSKLESMTVAGAMPHMIGQDSWQIKFRLINSETVVSRQSILFMSDRTLADVKTKIYVLIKILKYCTGSSAKSYQCKFAVNMVLLNRDPSEEEIGSAIREVIDYMTIKGKFSSIHPDLKKEGIIRVEVGDDGLHFIRENTDGLDDEQLLDMAIAMSLAQEEDMEEEEKMMIWAMTMSLEQKNIG
eukprot:GFUD01038103.1.p1 GENE.GFUD01038103.1~~GFUD01038103.1.p1  ORF type:complete len:555 (+),score=151.28 GFUD01038103.1:2-1666(+)